MGDEFFDLFLCSLNFYVKLKAYKKLIMFYLCKEILDFCFRYLQRWIIEVKLILAYSY
jgi:hypothetical protein